MVVGKKIVSFHIPNLQVDTWRTHHSNKGDLIESFEGKKICRCVKVKVCEVSLAAVAN